MPIWICGFDDPETGMCTRPPVGLPRVAGDLSIADEDLPATVREVFTIYCEQHRSEKVPDEIAEAYMQKSLRERASIRNHLGSESI